jgi:hypothetical protein
MQRSILDFVQAELKRFSQKVGTEDRQRIANHLDAVRRIELGLSAAPTPGTGGAAASSPTAGLGCGVPPGQFAPPVLPPAKGSVSVEATVKIHMDLAMAAFAADLTRVVVLQIGDQFANQLLLTSLGFTALGPNPPDAKSGDFNGLHSIALRNGADKATCDAWFQSQVAYMTGQMKGLIDPNGQSALDNGVVLGMSNMRSGQKVTTQQVPTVLAGSGGGYFKTGRSLALTGAPNNQLLVSLCNAMGTPVATFGEPRYGGELAALKG